MKNNQYFSFFFLINLFFSFASINVSANQEANSKEKEEERYEEF